MSAVIYRLVNCKANKADKIGNKDGKQIIHFHHYWAKLKPKLHGFSILSRKQK